MKHKLKRNIRVARYVLYKETLVDFREHFWTFAGSFIGIGMIGYLNSHYLVVFDNLFLIGSFGATAVLLFGVIESPLAQPRNLIGGHVISAIIGVTVNKLLPNELWLACALSGSLSIVMMQVTKTLHPPGGATALIAIIGSEKIKNLGYLYVFTPVLSGVMILFVAALIFNNMTPHRKYPVNRRWHRFWKDRYKLKKRRTLIEAD
jgi:CBS domain-containing membrane protein